MIYNGVHKVKLQKWNEVSIITDQVYPASRVSFDLPRKYQEKEDGRRLWLQGMIKLVRQSLASVGGLRSSHLSTNLSSERFILMKGWSPSRCVTTLKTATRETNEELTPETSASQSPYGR